MRLGLCSATIFLIAAEPDDFCPEKTMSGIYGVYRFDGAPVDPLWLERMKTAMAYYGPHGGRSKVQGPLGMGHLLLEVNPEDADENQPMTGARGQVVCAARLDNRSALLEGLHISAADAHRMSDGHLVSLAFDQRGEDLCTRIEGDWALAAWDARERRLLLAKDACGNANLYYYQGKGFVAFASSLKALLALPGIVKEPDRLRLVEVLVSWQHDAHLTAFTGFRRLVWAQAMSIDSQGQARTYSATRFRHNRHHHEHSRGGFRCAACAAGDCVGDFWKNGFEQDQTV